MNKKQPFLTVLIVYFVFFITSSSFAEASKKHIWEVGTEISYLGNRTMGGGYNIPTLKSHSIMYGPVLSYSYNGALPLLSPKINNCMLKIEGKESFGKRDNNGVWDNTREHLLEFRGLAGYNFSTAKKTIITPYSGIGYRHLKTNKAGVWNDNKIIYLYSPVGIEINSGLGKNWVVVTKLEYDYFFWGEVHTTNNFVPGDELNQERGYGLRGSVKFQKKIDKIDLAIEPFLKYWNIKESEKASSALSARTLNSGASYNIGTTYPKNHSTEIGVRFAVRF